MRRAGQVELELPLRTERLGSGNRKLLRDLRVAVDGRVFVVPAGFESDFSSYPWFTRWIVRWSKVDVAGVVHDYLYAKGACSRRYADRVWRVIAQAGEHRANAVQAWSSWLGLRLFGWTRYSRRRSGR